MCFYGSLENDAAMYSPVNYRATNARKSPITSDGQPSDLFSKNTRKLELHILMICH